MLISNGGLLYAFNESTTLRNLLSWQAAQLDGKAGIIQALFEEGGTLAHLGLGWPMVWMILGVRRCQD